MRNAPTSAPTSCSNGLANGGAMYGSPVSYPASTSSSAALSATVRVTTPSMVEPIQLSPMSGAVETRPRDGFRPTRPHSDAGILIDPPPSLA